MIVSRWSSRSWAERPCGRAATAALPFGPVLPPRRAPRPRAPRGASSTCFWCGASPRRSRRGARMGTTGRPSVLLAAALPPSVAVHAGDGERGATAPKGVPPVEAKPSATGSSVASIKNGTRLICARVGGRAREVYGRVCTVVCSQPFIQLSVFSPLSLEQVKALIAAFWMCGHPPSSDHRAPPFSITEFFSPEGVQQLGLPGYALAMYLPKGARAGRTGRGGAGWAIIPPSCLASCPLLLWQSFVLRNGHVLSNGHYQSGYDARTTLTLRASTRREPPDYSLRACASLSVSSSSGVFALAVRHFASHAFASAARPSLALACASSSRFFG